MKIEDASPFLQVNALGQRARQLITGAPPRIAGPHRRPAAIAIAEMQAGKIEAYPRREAERIIEEDTRELTENREAAREEARAALARMFGESDGEEGAEAESAAAEPEASESPESEAAPDAASSPEADEPAATEVEAAPEPAATEGEAASEPAGDAEPDGAPGTDEGANSTEAG